MRRKITKKIKRYNNAHKYKKTWVKLVSLMSFFAVIITICLLVLPAITLDKNIYKSAGNSLSLRSVSFNNSVSSTSGIQSLERSGKYIINAQVIRYDEIQSRAESSDDFIFFARSGDNYYAFGTNAQAIPIQINGNLQDDAIVTAIIDDSADVVWQLRSFYNTGVTDNIDIAIQSTKTGQYLFQSSSGFFRNDTNRRPGFFYINEDKKAPGSNIDSTIGFGLWTWNSFQDERIIQLGTGQFLNTQLFENDGTTPMLIENMVFDESFTMYCAEVTSIENDRETLTAKVITRQEAYNLGEQGNRFVIFMKSGDKYYAIDGDGNPQEVKLKGDLERGAIVYYGGTDTSGVSWDINQKGAVWGWDGYVDMAIRNIRTSRYLSVSDNQVLKSSGTVGTYYIGNPASGSSVQSDISSTITGYLNSTQCTILEYINGGFQIRVYPQGIGNDADKPAGDNIAVYFARVYEPKYIAFDPGNGNGTTGNNDTAGSMFDYGGTAGISRVEVDVGYYENNNHQVTITLPSDSQLNTEISIVPDDPLKYSIPREVAYPYTLRGWYNIATGDYYDVSAGSVTTTIRLQDSGGNKINNVFYADWVPTSYDYGASHEGTQYNAISTNDFITTKVFDFNELINVSSESVNQNGTVLSENWTDTGSDTDTNLSSFIFYNSHSTGSIANPNSLKDWNKDNTYTSTNGRWNITNISNALLTKLFDETGNTLGQTYVGQGDYLFHKVTDAQGNSYYEYDSKLNAASYNQTNGRFYVWDGLQYLNGSNPAFLPFNDEQTQSSSASINGTYNYWYGVTSEVNFDLSENVGTTLNKTNIVTNTAGTQSTDMTYYFEGDDDAWIFIDNQLVADLGGAHDSMSAEINFSSGEITIKNSSGTDYTSSRANLTVLSNLTSGQHTLKLYYLERNGEDSNLKIKLNMISNWIGNPANADTVSATKQWVQPNGITNPSSVEVNLYNGAILEDTETLNSANNWTYTWEGLDPNGNYSVRETTLDSYEDTYTSQQQNLYNYWSELYEMSNGEIIITNSNLNSSGSVISNNGYVSLNSNLQNTSITLKNGIILKESVNDSIIWILNSVSGGYTLQNKDTNEYLSVNNLGELSTTVNVAQAAKFYLSDLQGVRFYTNINGGRYSLVCENGIFKTKVLGSTSADYECARLYNYKSVSSSVVSYTITNTYRPTITLVKVDSEDKTTLSGITFTLTNASGKYYNATNGWQTECSELTTDNNGQIRFNKIPDGQYTLTETSTRPGYNMLRTPITITVLNNEISAISGNHAYMDTNDTSNLTVIVENVKGYKLPETGGRGIYIYVFSSLLIIMACGCYIFIKNKI